MFQLPGYAPPTMVRVLSGCPIRKSTDHSSFAAPRSLSQLYTSFIASACLGIHRVPFSALFIELARPFLAEDAAQQLLGFNCGPGGDEPHLATLGALHPARAECNTEFDRPVGLSNFFTLVTSSSCQRTSQGEVPVS